MVDNLIDDARQNGQYTEAAKLVYDYLSVPMRVKKHAKELFFEAVKKNDIGVVKILISLEEIAPHRKEALEIAATEGYISLFSFIHDNCDTPVDEKYYTMVLKKVASTDNIEMYRKFISRFPQYHIDILLDIAVKNCSLSIVREISNRNKMTRPKYDTVWQSVERGREYFLKIVPNFRLERCTCGYNCKSCSLLLHFAENGHIKCLESFRDRWSKESSRVLAIAIRKRLLDDLEWLLNGKLDGYDKKLTSKRKKTGVSEAFTAAHEENNEEALTMLIKAFFPDRAPLTMDLACSNGDINLVNIAIKAGWKATKKNFHNACEKGQSLVVEALLKAGHEPCNDDIMMAATKGQTEVISCLLTAGVSLLLSTRYLSLLVLHGTPQVGTLVTDFISAVEWTPPDASEFPKYPFRGVKYKKLVYLRNMMERLANAGEDRATLDTIASELGIKQTGIAKEEIDTVLQEQYSLLTSS